MAIELKDISIDRVVRSVEKVKQRLERATQALEQAGVVYAVIGGNAVAAWVTRVDEAAVRFTQDVDILVRRPDMPEVIRAMESAGFKHRHAAGIDMFLDGDDGKFRDAVHVIFAGEKVRDEYVAAAPDPDDVDQSGAYRVLDLESLVRMKLTSFRDKDRVHIRDLIGVGLVDDTWPARFEPELADRLQQLLDDPEG